MQFLTTGPAAHGDDIGVEADRFCECRGPFGPRINHLASRDEVRITTPFQLADIDQRNSGSNQIKRALLPFVDSREIGRRGRWSDFS